MVKIYDCFTFYNEYKMLEFRIAELNDVVDHFILVEANKTHANKPKPFFFDENKNAFDMTKIIHVKLDDMPDGNDSWVRERHQRNGINHGLAYCNPNPTDLILISDIDEIPDANLLRNLKENPIEHPCALEQDLYYYNLTCKVPEKWYHAKIMTYKNFQDIGSAADARFCTDRTLPNGGWHFSYFGEPEFILNKIQNFAHQELNTEQICNLENIHRSIANQTDPFLRNYTFTHVEIENNPYLPNNFHMLVS